MTKTSRNIKTYPQTPKSAANYAAIIFKGVIVSIAISIICALILSIVALLSDNDLLEQYLEYIMVGVTLASIFIGSSYAAGKIGSRGLKGCLTGIMIGFIYVLFSIGVSSDLGQNQILMPVLGNKIAAASLAGALGGFIGFNL